MSAPFIINTQEELDKINEQYFKGYPEEKGREFAGCHFYVCRGDVRDEPIGTARSIRDCYGCPNVFSCNLKKAAPTWLLDGYLK